MMMTTGPLPSLSPAIPASGGTARKSLRPDDQDGKSSSFDNFLPDKNGAGSSSRTVDADADAASAARLKTVRTAADEADDTKTAAAVTARPPGPPMMPPITALSAQQATLTAMPAATADEAANRAQDDASRASAAVDVVPGDPRSGMPPIRPHGPPPSGGTVAPLDPTVREAAPDTGGVKTIPSPIEPHGPPVDQSMTLWNDTRQMTTTLVATAIVPDDVKTIPPRIEPHGPPEMPADTVAAVPAPATGQVKDVVSSPIEPHGPPDLPDDTLTAVSLPTADPIKQAIPSPIAPHGPPDVAIKTATAIAADPIKQPAISPIEPHGPPDMPDVAIKTATTPAADRSKKATVSLIEPHGPPTLPDDTVAAAGGPIAIGGMAKGEYTTTIPGHVDDGQEAAALNAPPVGAPADSGGAFQDGGVGAPQPVYNPATPMEITSALQARVPLAGTPAAEIAKVKTEERRASEEEDTATAEPAPITALRPAILAARSFADAGRLTGAANPFNSQVALPQAVKNNESGDGTPAANEQAIVTAAATTTETNIDRSSLLRRGAAVSTLTGRATTIPGAEKSPAILPTAAVDTTALRADAPVATATNPVPAADQMQKMLQTILDAGIKTGANGASQMEMRVRLDGGTNDVTVRLQMQDSRMQVTFQTSSPELRQALERGWSDFTIHAAQTSPVTVEPPRFTADTTARSQNATDFSSGQQNPSRQDTRRSADDARPVAGSIWRGSQPGGSTATRPTPAASSSTSRWTGWA